MKPNTTIKIVTTLAIVLLMITWPVASVAAVGGSQDASAASDPREIVDGSGVMLATSSPSAAPYVNLSDQPYDPVTDSTFKVEYNASGTGAAASDLIVHIRKQDGTVVGHNNSLTALKGNATLTIRAFDLWGDVTLSVDLTEDNGPKLEESTVNLTANPSPNGYVNGTVSNSSGKVSGASISIINTTIFNTANFGSTDSTGNYSLRSPTGEFDVSVRKPNHFNETVSGEIVNQDATTFVNVTLLEKKNGGTINGTVTNGSGAVVGTTVTIFGQDGTSFYDTATTDSNGDYSIQVPPGTFVVEIKDSNHINVSKFDNKVEKQKTTTVDFDLTSLANAGTITGDVTNESGSPVTGIRVDIINESTGQFVTSDKTDSTGNYSALVEPGNYEVIIFATGYEFELVTDVKVGTGGTQVVDITLTETPPAGFINGTVVDPQGNPVPKASVFAADSTFTYFDSDFNDSGNAFSLKVPSGKYTVRADIQGYPAAIKEDVNVTAGQTNEVTLKLQEPAYINGTVLNSSGLPAANSFVVIDTDEGFRGGPVNQQGKYNITVPPGDYIVSVFARGGDAPSQDVSVTAGEVNTTDFQLVKTEVVHTDITIKSGPGDESKLDVLGGVQAGLLMVQVVNSSYGGTQPGGPPSELETAGVTENTNVSIELTVSNFTPSSLLWGIDNARWDATTNSTNSDYTDITINGSPVTLQVNFSQGIGPLIGQDPSSVQWPTGSKDRAKDGRNQTIYLGLFDLSTLPGDIRSQLAGMSVTTNAQQFSMPSVKNNTLRVWVAAPSKTVEGADHGGFYQATIPQKQLDAWGVTDPETELSALYKGSSTNFTVTNISDGGARIRIENITYSAGYVTIQADTGAPSVSGVSVVDNSGDDILTDGESVTVSATVTDSDGVDTVFVDASVLGRSSTLELTDDNGDDEYNATLTVNRPQAADDGTYRLRITANDTKGNETVVQTAKFELDAWDPSEDQVFNATAGVDVWERSVLPLRADSSGAGLQISNARWLLTLQTDGSSLASTTLNKDPVGVHTVGSDVTVTFVNGRAGAENQFDYSSDNTKVQLIAARLEANGSSNFAGINTVEDVRNLMEVDNANENATFEMVGSITLDSGGDGSFTFTPSKPGQYVLIAATNQSGGFAVDSNGNISLAGQTTIVGFDQVLVQQGSSTISTDQSAYSSGDNVSVTVNTSNVVDTDSGENTSHVVLIYDEKTFVNETFELVVDGSITKDFSIGDNVTLKHSIGSVNGIANIRDNVTFLGVKVTENHTDGSPSFGSIIEFIENDTKLTAPKTTATGNPGTVWNASVTVVNSTANDTIVVETSATWPKGEYRVVHFASNQNGTQIAANQTTITIDETQTPANVTASNLTITPTDGSTINVTDTVNATVDLENTGGLSGSVTVELLVNGSVHDSNTTSVAGGTTQTVELVTDPLNTERTANVTLVVSGTDLHQRKTATANITVVSPDTTPPAITLVSPAEGKVPYGTTVKVNITDEGTITSAYANLGGSTQDISGSNPRSITTGSLTEGTQTITVNATDDAGNLAEKSFTFDFVSAPSVDSFGPTGTATTDSPWVNVTYSDDAKSGDTGVDFTKTTLKVDGNTIDLSGAAINNGTHLNVKLSGLAEGSHTATLVITDNASHKTQKSWTFTVDSQPPAVSVTIDKTVVKPGTIYSAATARFNPKFDSSDVSKFYVEFHNSSGLQYRLDWSSFKWYGGSTASERFNGRVSWYTQTYNTGDGAFTGTDLATGDYQIVINVSDQSGRFNNASVNVTVDSTAPTITGTPEVGNGTDTVSGSNSVLTNDTATFLVNASDISSISSAKYTIVRAGGGPVGLGGSFSVNSTKQVDLTSLASGDYKIRVTITDEVGNSNTRTLSPTIKLDRTAPSLTSTLTTKNSSYLWVNVTSDEPISQPTGELTNSSDFARSVSFTKSGRSTQFNGTVAIPDANGQYNVTVKGRDAAGNLGTATASTNISRVTGTDRIIVVNKRTGSFLWINLTKPVNSPEVLTLGDVGQTGQALPPGLVASKFVSAEFNNSLIANVTIGVRVTSDSLPPGVSNDAAGKKGVNIRFFNTSSKKWEVTENGTRYDPAYDIPGVNLAPTGDATDDGEYWLTLRGHLSNHAPVTDDTTAPTITFDSPTNRTGGNAYPANTTSVRVNATLSDDKSGVNASEVKLLINGTDRTSDATVTASSVTGFNVSVSAGNAYNVTIVAADKNETANVNVSTKIFQVDADTSAPSVTIDTPTDGQSFANGTTSVSLNVSYSEPASESGIDANNISVSKNGTDFTTSATITSTTLNLTVGTLSAGAHNYTVRVPDNASNWQNKTVEFTIKADTTGPAIDINDVNSGNDLKNTTTSQTVTANVTDAETGVDETTIVVYYDDVVVTSNATINSKGSNNYTVSYDATGLKPDSEHNLTITASDEAGNAATPTTELFNVSADTAAPTISSLSPSNNSVLGTSGDTKDVTITIKVTDDVTGVDDGTVGLVFDGSAVTPTVSSSGGTTTITYDATGLSAGNYSYKLTVKDNATNTLTNTSSFQVKADNTDPTASFTVSDSSPNVNTQITFDASGSSDNIGIASYSWDIAGTSKTGKSVTHTFTSSGSKTVKLTVTDDAGNSDILTKTVSVQAASTGGGGGGGGGGATGGAGADTGDTGATTSTTTTTTEVKTSVSGLPAGGTVTISLDDTAAVDDPADDTGLQSLQIGVSEDSSFTITVTRDDGGEPPVDPEAGDLGYFRVDHTVSDQAVSDVTFTFRVNKGLLESRGLTSGDVALFRRTGGEWVELDTRVVSETNGAYVFEADSPGLSVFAVSQTKKVATDTPTTATPEPTTPTTDTPVPPTTVPPTTAPPTTSEEPGTPGQQVTTTGPEPPTTERPESPDQPGDRFPWVSIIVVVVIIGAVVVLYLRREGQL